MAMSGNTGADVDMVSQEPPRTMRRVEVQGPIPGPPPVKQVNALLTASQALKILDLRTVLQPETFDGREETFHSWAKSFRVMLLPLGIDKLLEAALTE